MIYFIGYIIMIFITAFITAIRTEENCGYELDIADYLFATFIGLFWPITLPFYLFAMLLEKLHRMYEEFKDNSL